MTRSQIDPKGAPLFEPNKLNEFFIYHLNRIHCAKAHLAERLPEIVDHAAFSDLKYALIETYEDVERQIIRMKEIYILLDTEPDMDECDELITMIENLYSSIHTQSDEPTLRDLSILFYMQNIESVEMASFDLLKLVATNFDNKQIYKILMENFNEAKGDKSLFLEITKKYLS